MSVCRFTDNRRVSDMLRGRIKEKAREILELAIEYAYAPDEGEARRHRAVGIRSACAVIRALFDLASAERPDDRRAISSMTHVYGLIGDYFDRALRRNVPVSPAAPLTAISDSRAVLPKRRGARRAGPDAADGVATSRGARLASKRQKSGIVSNAAILAALLDRRKKILQYLSRHGDVKIGDLTSAFNGVSARTLQRDLADLIEQRVVEKGGTKKRTVYRINTDASDVSSSHIPNA